jgi:hypothetical protein
MNVEGRGQRLFRVKARWENEQRDFFGFDLKDVHMVLPFKTTDLVQPFTKAQWTFISVIQVGFQMANQTMWHTKTLKGSHRRWDGLIFLKTSAPHSLMTTYRMNLISAGSISLDSTFKLHLPEDRNDFYITRLSATLRGRLFREMVHGSRKRILSNLV